MVEHTGRTTLWRYDANGRLLEEQVQHTGQANQQRLYVYDAVCR